MSTGSSSTRDPILDEDEDDWVQMKIIEGWSHGYLQMVSLLPESVLAINMMADWITTSFKKHHVKFPAKVVTPKVVLASPLVPSPLRTKNAETSESEKDDDILSFTPRRRRGSSSTSRSGSPAPVKQLNLPKLSSASSSDETTTSSHSVLSPDDQISHLSPPLLKVTSDSPSFRPLFLPPPLISHNHQSLPNSPHRNHHALREDLLESSLHHLATKQRPNGIDLSPPVQKSTSDDEILLASANIVSSSLPLGRSGSTGSLPSNFVDAKDLLRRRREDAVFGLSTPSGSAVASDEDEEGGLKGGKKGIQNSSH